MTDAEWSAQIERMNAAWQAKIIELLQDKDLRKWCMEKSLSCDKAPIAAEIYKFITAPVAALLKEK